MIRDARVDGSVPGARAAPKDGRPPAPTILIRVRVGDGVGVERYGFDAAGLAALDAWLEGNADARAIVDLAERLERQGGSPRHGQVP